MMFHVKTFFDLQSTIVLVLVALGISAAITGSKIGYPIRFLWCRIMPRPTWGMVRCPYCNAWWSGLVSAIVAVPDPSRWLAWIGAAFASLGTVRVIQAALGGDGIAMVEDFEKVFAKNGGAEQGPADNPATAPKVASSPEKEAGA